MAQMTPEQLMTIVVMAIGVFLVTEAWRERARWLPWVIGLWKRYVAVRLPQTPDDLAAHYDDDRESSGDHSQSSRNVHSDALERPSEGDAEWPPERPEWTRDQWLVFLANANMLDSEGVAQPFAKTKIAALLGIRAEDAGRMIDQARGEQPKRKAEPYQFAQVGPRQQFVREDRRALR